MYRKYLGFKGSKACLGELNSRVVKSIYSDLDLKLTLRTALYCIKYQLKMMLKKLK